tara:strand:+ start:414 stop:989 length:576 start_codon:yes stop_codon:yes gene_type:complete
MHENQEKINKYVLLAIQHNNHHNIFKRQNADGVWREDIFDCEPLLKEIKDNKKILDLGTGGGMPGILISIMKPKNNILLVEKNQKKAYFLKKVISELDLKNTELFNKNFCVNNNLGVFDLIVSRAFASIEKTLELTKKNINKNTKYLLLKGKKSTIDEELKTLDYKKYVFKTNKLDFFEKERHIVEIKIKE